MGPASSPTRGSIVAPRSASVSASVRRKLDFSTISDENSIESVSTAKKRAASALPAAGRLTKGTQLQALKQPLSSDNATRDDYYTTEMDDTAENGEDSFQMVDGASEDDFQMVEAEDDPLPEVQEEEAEAEDEPEPEPEVVKPAKKGKRKSPVLDEPVEPAKKGRRGRPKKAEPAAIQEEEEQQEEQPEEAQEEEEQPPVKRTRRSLDKAPEAAPKSKAGRPRKDAEAVETAKETAEASKPAKKSSGKSRQSGEASNAPKAKAKGSKPKLAPISEDSPAVKRGPPLPRNNRGLVILRRETPAEGTGFKQTRSGRNSIKPLAFWRNERVEYSEDENEDNWGKFLLPRIKEVVRTDEVDDRKPYRQKSKSKSSKNKKQPESEDEDEAEPWEAQPGRIEGEVRTWDPEDPTGQNTDIQEEEIALSSAAIVTQIVKDGSFKFAKTLTLPFFGSGMLDLRPGDKKKAKYSRKMQMVFFVHYGRVQVTVNGDNVFRIGKGGMWQVPRGMSPSLPLFRHKSLTKIGNLYSIENDYEQPARIFFAQGCELEVEEEVTQN